MTHRHNQASRRRCRNCGQVYFEERGWNGLCPVCADTMYAAAVEERTSREACPAAPSGVSADDIEADYEGHDGCATFSPMRKAWYALVD